MNDDIIDILIHNFQDGRTLTDVREDYEALQLMVEHERSANGEESRRLAALKVLAQFQLKLLLENLVETSEKLSNSAVSTK
jgi:hypothetical protein